MPTRRAALLAAVLLVGLAACSEPQGTDPGEAAASSAPEAADGESSSGKGGDTPGGSDKSSSGGGRGADGPGDGRQGGDSSDEGGGADGSNGSGGGSSTYPSAGEYVYAQSGFEKFCQGPSCERHPLPPEQTVRATYAGRSANGATVVTEARSSEQQTLTTTTRYSPSRAEVTNVVVEFNYGGFNFRQEYAPQPPVESLLFPLEVGKRWSGRWEARTSGDYSMRVVGTATFGGTRTYEIENVTNFRGDFAGRAQATIWVDPATRMVFKSTGDIAVASSFGEYTSSFETILRSGPGY